jgi:hypothetical protein
MLYTLKYMKQERNYEDMSLHSDTLFWFRANPSLLFLRNAACLAEKQQIPILESMIEPTIYRTRSEHAYQN